MRFWAINDLVRLPYLLAHNGPHLVLMVDVFVVRVNGTPFAYLKRKDETNIHKRGNMKICEKCQGSMVTERAVDLEVGLSILYFACLNCGKRIQAEKEPRPLVH